MLSKNDFIEIKFTGRTKEGEIFDTNLKEDAEKLKIEIKDKPLIICIGQNMILPAIDESLEGKEVGVEYSLSLTPDKAFGYRNPNLIKIIPINFFLQNKINPVPGMTLSLDNNIAKVISVSAGRVMVDFNNPLAGKSVIYTYRIIRRVDDINEKINSILEYFLGRSYSFHIETSSRKIIIEDKSFIEPFAKILNERFRDILNLEFFVNKK